MDNGTTSGRRPVGRPVGTPRRVVTYHQFQGASEKQVRSATDYIDRLGAPGAVTRELSKTGLRLDAVLAKDRRAQAQALEIALNEENERRLRDGARRGGDVPDPGRPGRG